MKTNSKLLFSTAAALGFLAVSSQAFAAPIPSSAEPSRAQGQIAPLEQPMVQETGKPLVSGSVAVQAPAGAEKVKFKLKAVKIEGLTVYSDTEAATLYNDMLDKTISLADVYGIAQRLTVKYRNDGYILTQVVVPKQTIDGGVVHLRVVEGFVDKITIQGKTRDNIGFLNEYGDRIRAEKPLNSKILERYLLLINDLPGMSARAILSPSPTVAGASDVTIVVEQKNYDLFGQIDNRGSKYLGPLQLNAGTRINNAFGMYEGINVQLVTAPDGFPHRELNFGGISWSQPINHEGTKVTVGGNITTTRPGYDLAQFDVFGDARALNLQVDHPIIRSRNENLTVALKLNYLDSYRKDNLGGPNTEDRLDVLRANATYQVTDRYVGINTFSLEASKGLDLFASDKGDANMTRALGDPQFFKATAEISRLQRLTNIFEVFATASGQKSADTLLASEEFGVGGINYGSAYDSSEITGEDGIDGRLELRANNAFQTPLTLLQLYTFYDIGKVWDIDNAVSADRISSLADTGFGFRANLNENLAGTFEVAFPLTRDVATDGDQNPRFFGSLTARF